jgi:hypothetical protein
MKKAGTSIGVPAAGPDGKNIAKNLNGEALTTKPEEIFTQ